jgi:raffinose/stachyose/melibiose transport system substrate-binding protein
MALSGAIMIAAIASCTPDTAPRPPSDPGPASITWAVVASEGPLREFWQHVADDFAVTHPNLSIKIEMYGSGRDLSAKLHSAQPPDLFTESGLPDLKQHVNEGRVRDITDQVRDELAQVGGSAAAWQVGGRTYGLPYTADIQGFWYNKAAFAKAGITATPTTISELNEAVRKLKTVGITPIILSATDGWPAALYWHNFALRACPTAVLRQATEQLRFGDPCFLRAGENLAAFLATDPFQPHYMEVTASQPSMLLVIDQAGMELSGAWDLGVLASLSPEPIDGRFGWFPFPTTGGAGDASAQLGGGTGFACSAKAPPFCVDLLKYIVSPDVQRAYARAGFGIPVVRGTYTAPANPDLVPLARAIQDSSYLQVRLDTAFGPAVDRSMEAAIRHLFLGDGTPQDVVNAMQAAASS